MLNYKGYEIPDTYEEIKESINYERIPGVSLPNVEYYISNTLGIDSTISLEEFYAAENDKEKQEDIVNIYLEVIKSYIDLL